MYLYKEKESLKRNWKEHNNNKKKIGGKRERERGNI